MIPEDFPEEAALEVSLSGGKKRLGHSVLRNSYQPLPSLVFALTCSEG